MGKLDIKTQKLFKKCHDFVRADNIKERGIYPYFRPIQESEGPVVHMEGRPVIMAGSNNYLGLTAHPKVKEAAISAIEKYGTSCSGSRYLTGTIDMHIELEHRLAKFIGKEAALLFSTGYQTGQGVINPLMTRGTYILSDRDNHASVVNANVLSKGLGANVLRFNHVDYSDLERQLAKCDPDGGILIVTDGVFSGLGDLANMQEIVRLADAYNAQILVDDAHALGVVGEGGRGSANHFGVDDEVDLIMCTFSKTLASLGGFVAGDERVINYLKHHSPALIFSASPTPPSVAAALAALSILESEPERVDRLGHNANIVREGLKDLGYEVLDGVSAIVPVMIGDDELAFKLWKGLFDADVFVNVFVSPACPPGMAMMRNSFMATHEESHLHKVIEVYGKVGKRLGVI